MKKNTNTTIYLAPMAGMTDTVFCRICRDMGADFTFSEMISAHAMCYNDKKTASLSFFTEDEGPHVIQIFGHDEEYIKRASHMLAGGDFANCGYTGRPYAINLNFGCPVRKIVSGGDGSAMMKDPDRCARIVEAAVSGAAPYSVPVSVKIRAGWDSKSINAVKVASSCASAGAYEIIVHGRTKEQQYMPYSDNEIIKKVRMSVPESVRVIGNGDVDSVGSFDRMVSETGCDGVMIGRAALSDPWLFAEIKAHINGSGFTPPTITERIDLLLELTRGLVVTYGETNGIKKARTRAGYLTKGIRGSSEFRNKINQCKTYKEAEILCRKFLDGAYNV